MAIAALACQPEEPGLLVTVELPEGALEVTQSVEVLVESPGAVLPMQARRLTDSGVEIEGMGGQILLRLPRSAYALRARFELLLRPSGPDAEVVLSGTLRGRDNALLGSAQQSDVLVLGGGRRTSALLRFSCRLARCRAPAPDGGVPDGGASDGARRDGGAAGGGRLDGGADAAPPDGPVLDLADVPASLRALEITGDVAGEQLVPIAVGHFYPRDPTRWDIVALSTNRHTAFIFFGSDWTLPGPSRLTPANAGMTIVGRTGESFGDAAGVGDLYGEGHDDLVLTATNATSTVLGEAHANAGVAYVFPGKHLSDPRMRLELDQDREKPRIYGTTSQERLGTSAAILRLSQGRNAVALGAPGVSISGNDYNGNGRYYVVFGSRLPIRNPPVEIFAGNVPFGQQDAIILGAQTDSQLGHGAAAGDFDGDGETDLAMSDTRASGGLGQVVVVSGARILEQITRGPPIVYLGSASDYFFLVSGNPGAALGGVLAFGDLDGDGRDELVASAVDAVYVFARPARAGLSFDISARQFDLAITGGDSFGASLALGDLDGDSKLDLVVGAPGHDGVGGARADAGACYVMTGASLGALGGGRKRHLVEEPATLTVLGAASGNLLGRRVAITNHDSSDDSAEMVLGAPGASDNRGRIHVLSGLPR